MLEEKYPGITSLIGYTIGIIALVGVASLLIASFLAWRKRHDKLTAIERVPYLVKAYFFHKENLAAKRNALKRAARYEKDEAEIYELKCEYCEARFLYLRFLYHPKHNTRLEAYIRGKGDLKWLEKNRLFISQARYGEWYQELYEKIDRLVHKHQVAD